MVHAALKVSWVTDKLNEVREQSDKVEVHGVIKRSYDRSTQKANIVAFLARDN